MAVRVVRFVVVGLIVLLALVATASARCGTGNVRPSFTDADDPLRVFAKAQSETTGPFLSLDPSAASANVYRSPTADASSGPIASGKTTLHDAANRPFIEFALAGGVPRLHYLNLSRPIAGTLYWQTAALSAASKEASQVRVELFLGERRLGGDEFTLHLMNTGGAWMASTICFRSELPRLEPGEPVVLRITRLSGLADFVVGTGGAQSTNLEFRTFASDPLAGALYLENGRLVGGGPEEEGTSEAAAPPAAASALPLASLGAVLAAGRPRRRVVLVALVLGVGAMGGCLGAKVPQEENAISEEPQPTAHATLEERPDLQASGHGAVEGRIRDENELPVAGAHVALLGTNHFTQSNVSGRFAFPNVTAGTFLMRVDAARFLPLEQDVVVETGKATKLDVRLTRPSTGSGNFKAHSHDVWGDDVVRVIDEFDFVPMFLPAFTVGGEANAPLANTWWCVGSVYCEALVPLDVAILPGTGLVEVTASWTAGPTT
ncbi:MAG: carboxypeptidase regulatory-like domain-containing protein, partial [Euryarchaeota archaeon]|nr:carboxypeptidase regulatory-like domain-containing protein [Euryarchaeota archaeon]